MGGLKKTCPSPDHLADGSLALIGAVLSGFYSKDSIIEAVAPRICWFRFRLCGGVAGVFVTVLFLRIFPVFHGEERFGRTIRPRHYDDEEVSADHHHGLAPGRSRTETGW